MVTILVDNRLRFSLDEVPEWVVERLKDAFTHRNPAYDKAESMGYWVGKMKRFIVTWEIEGDEMSLPRGGTGRLRELLTEAELEYRFQVRVSDGHPAVFPAHKLTLEPFQQRVVDGVVGRQNCIVKSSTGSGKTCMGINLISRLQRTTIVMLWTGALLKQWMDRLVIELGMDRRDIGVVGLGKFSIKPLTLAMQQTVYSLIKAKDPRVDELFDYFGLYIGDELQRWGSDTLMACTDPFRARYRVGMSADFTRHDHREFLIHDEFGQVAVAVDQDELIEQGVILDVTIRVVMSDFEADWYREEYREDGSRNPSYLNFGQLLDVMCSDDARNALIQETIGTVVQEGGVMVFCHRVEHCQTIDQLCVAKGIQSGLMIGGATWSHVFDATKDGLMSRRLKVGIGTFGAIGQAIDVPAVSRGVVATPVNNNRQMFGQVRGRMCRANRAGSADAELWYILDRKVFGMKPLRNLIAWNNNVLVRDERGNWIKGAEYLSRLKRQPGILTSTV